MQRQFILVLLVIMVLFISGGFAYVFSFNNAGSYQNMSANSSHSLNSTKVAVIIPHPDDESIGMGGTIQRLKNEGKEVHCVLLTNGNGITDRVPVCNNYYGLNIPENATTSDRKRIIREDSFKRVMEIYNCSYEMIGIDDAGTTPEIVYNIMEKKAKEGYTEFYTTTKEVNIDHSNCQNATAMMLEKYPQLKYRLFPVYWHASPKYTPKPFNYTNYTDYDVSEFISKKRDAFEVYYNIDIFKRGTYSLDIERIYYLN